MKALTRKQKEWLWFIGLWCAGLGAVYSLAYIIRLMIGLDF